MAAPLSTSLWSDATQDEDAVPESYDVESVKTVLKAALSGIVDDQGFVTAEGLTSVAGFDEAVAVALENELGPGPWQLAELEALLGEICQAANQELSGGSMDNEEGLCAGDYAAQVKGRCQLMPDTFPKKGPFFPSLWGKAELHHLEEVVNMALLSEDFAYDGAMEEPEGEDPREPDTFEVNLEQLQRAAMRTLITPILEADCVTGAARQLPLFVDELLALLRKSWRLAGARGGRVRHMTEELVQVRAEARTAFERACREEASRIALESEVHGEKAHDILEGTVARLTATRKALKEKEWELADARQRIEQLDRDRCRQEQQIRHLETLVERETLGRHHAERRISEALAEAEAEAAQQRGELRRRLSAAQQDLEESHEELSHAEQRMEELRLHGEQRVGELENQLVESHRLVQFLRQRLEDGGGGGAAADAAPNMGAPPPSVALSGVADLSLKQHPAARRVSLGVTPVAPSSAQPEVRRPPVSVPRLQLPRAAARPVPRPATAAPQEARRGSAQKTSTMQSLPMDLRALGKLLTGHAVKTPRVPRH